MIKTGAKLIPDEKLVNFALAKANLPDEIKLKILESLISIANERQCSLVELVLSKEILEFIKTGCELAKDVKQIWIPEVEDSGEILDKIKYER